MRAFEQRRLGGLQAQVVGEVTSVDLRPVAVAHLLQLPSSNPDIRAPAFGSSEPETAAGDFLGGEQMPNARIADRRLGEINLLRIEGAGVFPNLGRAQAKKSDLKAQRRPRRGVQMAGDVPPLEAKLRMTAIGIGKPQRLAGADFHLGRRQQG